MVLSPRLVQGQKSLVMPLAMAYQSLASLGRWLLAQGKALRLVVLPASVSASVDSVSLGSLTWLRGPLRSLTSWSRIQLRLTKDRVLRYHVRTFGTEKWMLGRLSQMVTDGCI